MQPDADHAPPHHPRNHSPSESPTAWPSESPTTSLVDSPTDSPKVSPTVSLTALPTVSPTASPTPLDSAAPPHPSARPVRSFVLRGGRMGSGQIRALRELGPRFVLPFNAEGLDWDQAFGRRAPRVLEIGFGMGQATAEIAAARPEVDFIGVEVHEAGVGALLRAIGERGLGNVRIVRHDAVEVLNAMVAPASLAGIHLFFPDPWPKARHHKRRLVQPAPVALMASRLAVGGRLHCATDWQPYAEQMRAVLNACPALANSVAHGEGWAERGLRPRTKFEARGLALGHGVWDLVYERRPAAPPGESA